MNFNTIQQRSTLEAALEILIKTANTAQRQITSSAEQAQAIARVCKRPYKTFLSPFGIIFNEELKKLSQDSKDLEVTGARLSCILDYIQRFLKTSRRVHFDDSVEGSSRAGARSLTTLHTTYCEGRFDRICKVEMLGHLVRELCWTEDISDCIEPKWWKRGDGVRLFSDWEKKKGLEGQHSGKDLDTNIVLRCYLMADVYQLLHCSILVSDDWEAKRTPRDTYKAISNLLIPFFKHPKEFIPHEAQLSTIIDRALDLRNMLAHEGTGAYTMVVPKLENSNCRISVLGDSVRVMGVVGAQRVDDSRDLARLVMFGALKRQEMDPKSMDHRRVLETKPWVLVYRPGKHEPLREDEMLQKGYVRNVPKE